MTKREFLAASVGAGLALTKAGSAFAQQAAAAAPRTAPKIPSRTAKTTKLFKSPPGFPNGIAVTPEGLWIGEQKQSGRAAANYHLPEPKDLSEAAWLVDWNGKLLKTVTTPSRNTSGHGGWRRLRLDGRQRGSRRRLPGGHELQAHQPPPDSARCPRTTAAAATALFWHEGKLWIASLRLRGNLRVDPTTWEPEFMIPFYRLRREAALPRHRLGRWHHLAGHQATTATATRKAGPAWSGTTPRRARCWRSWTSRPVPAIRTGSPCTTASWSAAMRAFIRVGPPTTAPPAAGSSRSSWSDLFRRFRCFTHQASADPRPEIYTRLSVPLTNPLSHVVLIT